MVKQNLDTRYAAAERVVDSLHDEGWLASSSCLQVDSEVV